jgi:hypothetical protein
MLVDEFGLVLVIEIVEGQGVGEAESGEPATGAEVGIGVDSGVLTV